jgi:fermentation-respiration switch protein FrsA (DUF1100 family)
MNMVQIILIIVSILLLLMVATGFVISQLILYPKVRDELAIYEREIRTKRFPEEFYKELEKEEVWIQSEYGYRLSCYVLENELTKQPANRNKIAIFCHGYKASKTASMVYAKILMDLGYTAIVYDHRNHGNSDKKFTSMGYYEKFDLKTIVDWCFKRYGQEIQIITHGESMGSATVLGHLSIDDRVTAAIADCGYSDLGDLLKHQLRNYFHLPYQPFLPIAKVFIKLRGGFKVSEVSPKTGALQSKTPILFIHGDSDDYVPTKMSVDMYEQRTGEKELFLQKDAKHALACVVDYDRYYQVVQDFVTKVEANSLYSDNGQ